MGLDIANLTDEQLEKIERENDVVDEWLAKKLGMERHYEGSPFDARNSKWWNCDRLILHTELFKTERAAWIQNDLPEEMVTYVRNQFKGSTEKITKAKIQGVISVLSGENPDWWYGADRKVVFLQRFSVVHPGCCDGKRPESKATARPPKQTAQPTTRKVSAATKADGKKIITIDGNLVIGIIVVLVILYFIFK